MEVGGPAGGSARKRAGVRLLGRTGRGEKPVVPVTLSRTMLACRILQAVVLFFAFLAQVNQAQLFEEVGTFRLLCIEATCNETKIFLS